MEDEILKPNLRFPEFNEDWIPTTFDSHFSFKNTNSLSRENLNYINGVVMNIHYGDIHTSFKLLFDVTKEKVPYVNPEVNISNINEENYVLDGDLIIADASENYADIGKTIEVINTNNERILSGLHTFLARKEDKTLANGFFGFLLTTYKARFEIMKIAQGTKVLGISKNRLDKIPLYIPKPEEQKKIADFITAIDVRINLLKIKKTALEDYKKSIMQKLFSRELRFKEEDGSDFPEWRYEVLGEIGEPLNGLTGKTKVDFGEGKPYIQYMQIFKDSKINPDDFGFVRIGQEENQTTIQFGDVLFTTSSETPQEVGISSVMLDDIEEVYLNSFSFGFRPNSLDVLVPEFSQFLFRSSSLRKQIIKLAQGSTRYNMSKVSFMKERILIPEKNEQIKISKFLSKIDKKINSHLVQIQDSELFKKSLLQKLFI